MLLLLLVELLLHSCIGAEAHVRDLYKKTLTFMATLWGSRCSARQFTNAQDVWPQFLSAGR